jgi:hypothetical protein
MTVLDALQAAIESRASDGHEARVLTDKIFSRVRALMHALVPDMPWSEIDLRLADLQRDTHEELFKCLYDAIDYDNVVDTIAHFLGED